MAAGDTTPGRRRPDETPIEDLEPGDYKRATGGAWWIVMPDGTLGRLDDRWSFTVHDDGTLTVGPATPGGSYSIQDRGPGGWHGYLEHGVWREV